MRTFKKPFSETKFGKIVTGPLVKGALGMVPFGIGSALSNVLDQNGTDPGTVDPQSFAPQMMKIVIYVVLIYLALSGKLTWEDAEQAKSFINQ